MKTMINFVKEKSPNSSQYFDVSQKECFANNTGKEVAAFYTSLHELEDSQSSSGNEILTAKKPASSVKSRSVYRLSSLASARQRTPNETASAEKIFHCATNNDIAGVLFCLKRGIDVNSVDAFSWTPLMCAVAAENRDIIQLLLRHGADKSKRNLKGFTATDLARSKGIEANQILELLLKDDLAYPESPRQPKCDKKNGSQLKHCSLCGVDYSGPDHHSSTAHLFCCQTIASRSQFSIPASNKGYQLLIKEGWDEESGLGPRSCGRKYPIKTQLKLDRTGLGIQKEITHFQAFDEAAIKHTVQSKTVKKNSFKRRCDVQKAREKNFRRQFFSPESSLH